jgi:NAD(P) transhydrogenase subunit alpha
MTIRVGVPKEIRAGEQRVALVPDVVKKLNAMGVSVSLESGAGDLAGHGDADYAADIAPDDATVLGNADIVLTVNPLQAPQIEKLKDGAILIGYLNPWGDLERFTRLKQKNISAFSMELIPRISRAQAMDALSSQASIAGYKAVLIASTLLGKFFPMLTTAAARRLGAIVEGYDVRAAVKDQVESLGAKFVDIDIKAEGAGGYARELTAEEKAQQQAILARHVAAADVLITTAAIPGRPSPKIISREMVEGMKGGSVIVDLAAEGGGNCELTRPGETLLHNRVKIHGPINVPSTVSGHASELYAKNLLNLLGLLIKDGQIHIDLEDQILKDSLITHGGAIVNAQIRDKAEGGAQ